MIDLNRIRSLKTLDTMKRDLIAFINNPDVLTVYVEDLDWGQEDYEADIETATYLLENVEHRIKSLGRFIAKQSKEQS